ncbi:MAG TPA: circadian clock KaiB family protein [Longimicrobiales bacterium]|nr:circadian clock KaiB family protein [Longimicrobiales bacterium]
MKLHLTLFVAGETPRSEAAVRNVERLRGLQGDVHISLEVVDVLRDPERAETARVMATPTLIREVPTPPRRVTGDLDDLRRVMAVLGLHPLPAQHTKED